MRGWCRCLMGGSWSWWSLGQRRLIWETGGTTPSTEEVTTDWQIHNKWSPYLVDHHHGSVQNCRKTWYQDMKYLIYDWNIIRQIDWGLLQCLLALQVTSLLVFPPGYHDNHIVIRWFWAAVERFNNEQRLRLLQVSDERETQALFIRQSTVCVLALGLKCLCRLSLWQGRPVSRTRASPLSGAATGRAASVWRNGAKSRLCPGNLNSTQDPV